MKYIERFLQIEPQNEQAKNLLDLVKSKRVAEATKGAAVVGGNIYTLTKESLLSRIKHTLNHLRVLSGAAMIAGGLLALGFGLLKK